MGNTAPVKRIAVLGATGSIGRQTLDIVRNFPRNFRVIALSGGQNTALLKRQIDEFQPEFVYADDRAAVMNAGVKFLDLEEMAVLPDADIVVMAISGTAGLQPALAAVRAGKTVALANKESLVIAGEIISGEAKRSGARILPVDSEHSAIWQCLRGENRAIARLLLTASGGPFLHYSLDEMKQVTAGQALRHPSWQMGKKITVDSATLMNKGLEVIEARWLYDVPIDNIEVLIHPQSIVHSMVEFIDGSTKAQLSCPDMRLPILYALSYPARFAGDTLPRIDWSNLRELTFEPPDTERFPCLRMAIEAGRKGGTYPAVLCSADEAAVELFLTGHIRFTDIADLVAGTLAQHNSIENPNIEDIISIVGWARERVKQLVKQ